LIGILHTNLFIGAGCDDAFVVNSTCYKNHKESVHWFTAVNRCLAKNTTLAVLDDDVRQYFPSDLFQKSNAWIGLVKSWWAWPGLHSMPKYWILTLFDMILGTTDSYGVCFLSVVNRLTMSDARRSRNGTRWFYNTENYVAKDKFNTKKAHTG